MRGGGVKFGIACDHALSLYLFNLFSEGGHDTILSQMTWKKATIWTFFDWIGNNEDDLRCSDWPKWRHPFNVDFSLHFWISKETFAPKFDSRLVNADWLIT